VSSNAAISISWPSSFYMQLSHIPRLGIHRLLVPTLDEAKAKFRDNWTKAKGGG
jgi:hypothetical protein